MKRSPQNQSPATKHKAGFNGLKLITAHRPPAFYGKLIYLQVNQNIMAGYIERRRGHKESEISLADPYAILRTHDGGRFVIPLADTVHTKLADAQAYVIKRFSELYSPDQTQKRHDEVMTALGLNL